MGRGTHGGGTDELGGISVRVSVTGDDFRLLGDDRTAVKGPLTVTSCDWRTSVTGS